MKNPVTIKTDKYIVLAICFILCYGVLLAGPQKNAIPPFDCYETYLLENDSLIIKEINRSKGSRGTAITYQIKAEGFTPNEPIFLWRRNGGDFLKYEYNLEYPVELSSEVLIEINLQIEGFKRGQALDIALVSDDTSKFSHRKIYPFPLGAKGTGGCSVIAELWSKTGHLFLMIFRGFDPGEKVRIMNRLGRWMETSTTEASDEGIIYYCAGFSKRARGTAVISAFTCDRKIRMEYKIGKDALKLQ